MEKPTDIRKARVMYSISKAMPAKREAEPYNGFHFEAMFSWCWTWSKPYAVRTARNGQATKRARMT